MAQVHIVPATSHRGRTAKFLAMTMLTALFAAAPLHSAFAQTAPELGSAATFTILGGTAVTCTDSTIIGDIGSGLSGSAITQTNCTVKGTVHPGDAIAMAAYDDFLVAYDALADPIDYACTGTLDTVYTDTTLTLAPGVYCNDAAVTFTRTTLTLDAQNDANAVWIFKVGTLGTGALTGTGLTVVMANGGEPCNVYWWVAEAVTMSASNFKGNLLAGAATTFTGGSLIGRDFAIAAVTMTGLDAFGCGSLIVPPVPPTECKDCCHDNKCHDNKCHDNKCHDNDHGKDRHHAVKKHCNQGVGNGPEKCDPGNSNQGDSHHSNDELGGTPGNPGRKGGNK